MNEFDILLRQIIHKKRQQFLLLIPACLVKLLEQCFHKISTLIDVL